MLRWNVLKSFTIFPLYLKETVIFLSCNVQQQMYIAQVLQDPNSDETGAGSGEDDGQGSSQDEEMLNGGNGLNEADFQSGEDSLIANEVHQ